MENRGSGVGNKSLLSVESALEKIIKDISVVSTEETSLTSAINRVTAVEVRARRCQPPVAVSAMDGYAVKSMDVKTSPRKLVCIGSVPAGSNFRGHLKSGEAVRIFTGAPVPKGADTIVIQENVVATSETDGSEITVLKGAKRGIYIRKAGLDFKTGDVGIPKNKRLTSRDIGLAAAMNVPWILVRRRPRIAIIATGDEIVRPGELTSKNQIVSSNSYTLHAFLTALGADVQILGVAPDDTDAIGLLAKEAEGSDLLVTTGGASVGKHDLIQEALSTQKFGKNALKLNFWKIAMRPGKPLIFGKLQKKPFIGLPGNPVSTMICGLIFLKPAIETMLGLEIKQEVEFATLAYNLPENDERQDYLRSFAFKTKSGDQFVEPFAKQDSSMMAKLAQANCLIVREPFDKKKKKGDLVKIIKLDTCL